MQNRAKNRSRPQSWADYHGSDLPTIAIQALKMLGCKKKKKLRENDFCNSAALLENTEESPQTKVVLWDMHAVNQNTWFLQ